MKRNPSLSTAQPSQQPSGSMLGTAQLQEVSLEIVYPQHPMWEAAIEYVQQRYELAFSAHLHQFMPAYLVLAHQGHLLSLCGFRIAADEPLFLEQYLDQPAEHVLSQRFASDIQRSNLIEFGHLASFTKGTSPIHFYLMAEMLVSMGFEWCIFTATDPLHALMTRMGLEPQEIARADPNCLANAESWGSYYEHQPRILAGNLRKGLDRLHALFQRSQRHA
ncbi:TPA: delta-VPH [Vibrio vulnificus]|nr:delta-VPH [Vibrio vulnificus]